MHCSPLFLSHRPVSVNSVSKCLVPGTFTALYPCPTPPGSQGGPGTSELRHPFSQLLGALVAHSSSLNPFPEIALCKRATSCQVNQPQEKLHKWLEDAGPTVEPS